MTDSRTATRGADSASASTEPRWDRVEELFFAAADLTGSSREAFLRQACGGDARLRREVDSLLAVDATGGREIGGLIEGTIESAAGSLFSEDASGQNIGLKGLRLGPWVIVREIGSGGMGSVYLAARADEEFRKQVAIKLVRRGVDTEAMLKRFVHERQILAGLDHPNIARLLDGGTSPDRRPYFVMEYVEGVPIHTFCEQSKLGIAERCRLFLRACDPVSYAHRNLVIHRDLKPANILVGKDGTPKLLDFGIARLLNLQRADDTGARGDSLRPYTPAYASPEQLRGDAVNTATDIFSLGAVLFEILTGTRPPRGADNRAEIPAPSVHAQSAAARKALAGDLDNIVRKATRPDPAERYQSVDQLSDDLRRYLSGRPVTAREDSFTYRAGKFVQRNRLAVAASAAAALVLVAGVGLVLWQSSQTRMERRRAEERLDELVEVANQTMLQVHGSIERLPGGTSARREIVSSTLAYLDKLNAETGNDKRILSAMATAYTRLAKIEGNPLQPNLGDYKGAERSYTKAAAILDQLIRTDPGNVALRMAVADCSDGLGEVLSATGDFKRAGEQATRGLAAAEYVLVGDPANIAARKSAILLHLLRATANAGTNRLDPARAEVLEQIPAAEKLAGDCPSDADCVLPLAAEWSQLGVIEGRQGKIQESIAAYQKSTALREKLAADHPSNVAVERDLMLSYGHLGDSFGSPFLPSRGDRAIGLTYYRKAAAIADRMAAADPTDRQAKADLGIVLGRIGSVLSGPGETSESLAALERSAAILSQLIASTPDDLPTANQLTRVFEYQGQRRRSRGDLRGALESYLRSLDICNRVLKAHAGQPACLRQSVTDNGAVGVLQAALGDRTAALRTAAGLVEEAEAAVAAGPATSVVFGPRSMGWTGDVYLELARDSRTGASQRAGDLGAAREWYTKALAAWEQIEPGLRKTSAAEPGRVRDSLAECTRLLDKRG